MGASRKLKDHNLVSTSISILKRRIWCPSKSLVCGLACCISSNIDGWDVYVDVTFDKFTPDKLLESDDSLLERMDSLFNAGITGAELHRVFIQCDYCDAMTARHNIHFHRCAVVAVSQPFTPRDRLALLYSTEAEGLKPGRFEALLTSCMRCKKFMTSKTSIHHDCLFEARYKAAGLTPMV